MDGDRQVRKVNRSIDQKARADAPSRRKAQDDSHRSRRHADTSQGFQHKLIAGCGLCVFNSAWLTRKVLVAILSCGFNGIVRLCTVDPSKKSSNHETRGGSGEKLSADMHTSKQGRILPACADVDDALRALNANAHVQDALRELDAHAHGLLRVGASTSLALRVLHRITLRAQESAPVAPAKPDAPAAPVEPATPAAPVEAVALEDPAAAAAPESPAAFSQSNVIASSAAVGDGCAEEQAISFALQMRDDFLDGFDDAKLAEFEEHIKSNLSCDHVEVLRLSSGNMIIEGYVVGFPSEDCAKEAQATIQRGGTLDCDKWGEHKVVKRPELTKRIRHASTSPVERLIYHPSKGNEGIREAPAASPASSDEQKSNDLVLLQLVEQHRAQHQILQDIMAQHIVLPERMKEYELTIQHQLEQAQIQLAQQTDLQRQLVLDMERRQKQRRARRAAEAAKCVASASTEAATSPMVTSTVEDSVGDSLARLSIVDDAVGNSHDDSEKGTPLWQGRKIRSSSELMRSPEMSPEAPSIAPTESPLQAWQEASMRALHDAVKEMKEAVAISSPEFDLESELCPEDSPAIAAANAAEAVGESPSSRPSTDNVAADSNVYEGGVITPVSMEKFQKLRQMAHDLSSAE